MSKQTIVAELQDLVEKQRNKYNFVYPTFALVPFPSTGYAAKAAFARVDIASDSPFRIERISMAVIAPVVKTDLGLGDGSYRIDRVSNQISGGGVLIPATSYPLAGVKPTTPASVQYADRGLTVKITESRENREFTDGYARIETVATPGYRESMFQPLPFNYIVRERAQFRFDFINEDTAPTLTGERDDRQLYHYVTIALLGNKYFVPSGAAITWE
jgi:hypothetical protein